MIKLSYNFHQTQNPEKDRKMIDKGSFLFCCHRFFFTQITSEQVEEIVSWSFSRFLWKGKTEKYSKEKVYCSELLLTFIIIIILDRRSKSNYNGKMIISAEVRERMASLQREQVLLSLRLFLFCRIVHLVSHFCYHCSSPLL